MLRVILLLLSMACITSPAAIARTKPHNVIIFVADGLRGTAVDAHTAANIDALRREGTSFPNSHSLFPTVTTANASAIATGHLLGDTGDFANTIYAGFAARLANGETSVTPFVEDDIVLGDLDEHFDGDYLGEMTLLATARREGFSTAAIGKLGPTLIQDHGERSGAQTIVLDDRTGLVNDRTGQRDGIDVSPEVRQRMLAAGLAGAPPATDKPNRAQQQYFVDAATKVVLPLFKERGKAFIMVMWMRDPDTSQHNQLDSRPALVPGINGSTSLSAVANTDRNLGDLRAALKRLGLDATTDIIVTSDHGFSTISKQSDTSAASRCAYDDVPAGYLPPGFLALDIANALDLPLRDPDMHSAEMDRRCDGGSAAKTGAARHPRFGNGLIGFNASAPEIVVTTGAGAALIYLRGPIGTGSAGILVNFLLTQDYVGGVFVASALAHLPGTIPLADLGLEGSARTPHPDIIVSFRSFSTGCDQPLRCAAEVADTTLGQGQGMHGAFSRADTYNFMAAIGPDFRSHFVDPAPVSNADLVPTLAKLLQLPLPARGALVGRILDEALPGGSAPAFQERTCLYPALDIGQWPAIERAPLLHLQPAVRLQSVGATRYFDAAGIVDRTLGLEAGGKACAR